MKIYTKTGDQGTTGLFAGPRVSKDDPRIVTYGCIDELNSLIGVAIAAMPPILTSSLLLADSLESILRSIQSDLFSIGAELATPDPDAHKMRLLNNQRISCLENWIDSAETELIPLTGFILPGGSTPAAFLHYSRTVCRRAEQNLVGLMKQPDIADYTRVLVYLNRLSDFLFVVARLANHRSNKPDLAWVRST